VKLKSLIIGLMLFAFAIPLFAQTTATVTLTEYNAQNSIGWYVANELTVDSAATKWTNAFTLPNFDAESFTTYPFAYTKRETKFVSNDSLNYSIYVYGCSPKSTVDANWQIIDTLFANTTLKATATPAAANGTANFNNKKFPLYKLCIVNKAGAKKFKLSDFSIFQAKKDN
jgi:hypothetical protein